MTTRERVLTSRLIQKIDTNKNYAKQIGLSYTLTIDIAKKNNNTPVQKKEKKN